MTSWRYSKNGASLSDLRCEVVRRTQDKLGIPASTLSHHISSLASAGLISQRREGRTLYCVAEYECLDTVIGFLRDECCINENC